MISFYRNFKISAQQEREASGSFDEDDLENIFKKLPNDKDTVAKLCSAIVPADFEKDDDSNRHIDFIVACSNSRAANYGIEPADRSKSKVILIKVIVRKGAYKIDIRSALRGASFLPLLRLRRWSPVLFRLNFTKLSMESTILKSIKILSSTWRCRLSHFLSLWHQQRYLKRIEEFENFKWRDKFDFSKKCQHWSLSEFLFWITHLILKFTAVFRIP